MPGVTGPFSYGQLGKPPAAKPPPPPQRSAPALLNPGAVAPPAPSGFLGQVGGALGVAGQAVQHATQAATTPHTAPQAGSDIQSSGANYGSAQADAFKQTPAYRQAIVDTFLHQPKPQAVAIINGALKAPSYEGSIVLQYLGLGSKGLQAHLGGVSVKPMGSALPSLDSILGAGTKLAGQMAAGQLGGIAPNVYGPHGVAQAGLAPGNLISAAVHGVGGVIRAGYQDPIGVGAKTAKGLADTVAGSVAGAVQLPINIVQQGPGPALSQLAGQVGQDYSRRYGPLVAGNDQAFINRIKQEGAGPEIFDAAMLAGGLDATAGKALAGLGKLRKGLTGSENFLTRPRPDLLISGNKARPQALANTAGRIVAQRLEDKVRGARKPGELVPRGNQLAPIFQSHAIRVVHSGIAQKWRRTIQENLRTEVRGRPGSALSEIGKLNGWQRQAVYHAVHGLRVDTPAHFRADLADRRAQIVADRQNPVSLGNRIPAQHVAKVDELALIDKLTANADKIAGPKMVAFQAKEAARSQRIGAATNLHPATAEARVLRPVGDRLGIEHPDAAAARVQQELAAAFDRAKTTPQRVETPNPAYPQDKLSSIVRLERGAKTPGEKAAAQAAMGRKMGNLPPRTISRDNPEHLAAQIALARAQRQAADYVHYASDRPNALAAYVKQVRAGMDKHAELGTGKLPEPGYFRHQEFPDVKFGDFTSGSGHRAMPADKQSTWALHRAGVADHSAQAYIQGLARSIKRPYQWRLTDEQFRAAALATPTRNEIKGALGQEKAAHLLTGHELRRVLAHRGEDMSKLSFYNPGRLAEQTLADHGLLPKGKVLQDTHTDQTNAEMHQALQQEGIVQHGKELPSMEHAGNPNGHGPGDRFLTTQGWKAIPRTAFDEIHAGLKGGSLGGRLVGKVQGTSAGLILGQNPHFLIMNTLAHLFPAIAGTKGAILPDLLKAPFWWHGLSEADRNTVRGFEGGRGGHYNVTARLGSQAPNQIAAFGRQLGEHGLAQKAQAVNPLHAILRAEDTQSNFFRHAVMYHEIKRAAYQDMSQEYGRAVAGWEQVKNVFSIKDPQQRMQAIVHNMPKMEELGRTAVNILGDYGRFTARERAFLNNRAVMFYSFLRHVTRTLLYVLPIRHPLAFGMMGELGNLHVQEVKKLLGGQDLPWAYGRLFFDNKQKLSSIDLTSTSPISSPLVDVMSGGVKQLPRLLSPALAPLLDVAYGQTPQGAPVQRNLASYANSVFSLSYPYRTIAAKHYGLTPQQSDSIPFIHERPQTYKTAAAQQYQAAKTAARGPLDQYLLGTALGIYPKPDDSRVIAQHMAAKAASKGRRSTTDMFSGGAAGPADMFSSPASTDMFK